MMNVEPHDLIKNRGLANNLSIKDEPLRVAILLS
jgi:hypothetical protein